jgi:multidrug efflux pump subunit AcrA (membrane-fusion protein)
MSAELLPETRQPSQPLREQAGSDFQDVSQGRRWWRGLLAIAAIAALVSAPLLIPRAGPSREIGSDLLHSIARRDLIVTITEQGTLESSNNTEIKCRVRGESTVIWVIESGAEVEPGDELVRLDTLALEDAIAERKKFAHLSRSSEERARADVARAKLAIPEYLKGRYQSELMTLEKDLAIIESSLLTAQNVRDHVVMLEERGYASALRVEEAVFAVRRAKLNVDVKEAEIDALKNFTKEMELETLNGQLNAAKARLAANEERARMDAERRDLAIDELQHCVVKAEKRGLVIHPSAATWKDAPEIEEGATVHMDQVLLLMPDLSQMQVKVGIHESIVDHVTPGMAARVTLADKTLEGEVSFVSPVTRPAGWWTGNVVKYDTIIELPSVEGLKPGMSAEVELILNRYDNVLTIPAAAVVETVDGDFCWLKTAKGTERRSLRLGDTDDMYVVVREGLHEGDEVVLDPLASIAEAQAFALKPLEETSRTKPDSVESHDNTMTKHDVL